MYASTENGLGGTAGAAISGKSVAQAASSARLSAPRRCARPSARTPFSVVDNPALFDLATLRCVSNYYRATGRMDRTAAMQPVESDTRGRGYGYGATGTAIRLHAPSLLTTHGCTDKSMPA